MKHLAFLILFSTQLWAQVNLDVNPLLGISIKYQGVFVTEENYQEKVGLVKKDSISWDKIMNSCGADFGELVFTNNVFNSNRCCYKTLEELGVVGEPLSLNEGVQGLVNIPQIQSIDHSSNAIFSIATAQFKKVKVTHETKNILATCVHVLYENTIGMNPEKDTLILAKAMKSYANNNKTWKLDYFYIVSKTPCQLIANFGDVNLDGKISSLDLLRLSKEYVNKNNYHQNYDFNSDGKLDSKDVELLRSFILKTLVCP